MTIGLHDNLTLGITLLRLDDCMMCKFHTFKTFVAKIKASDLDMRLWVPYTQIDIYVCAITRSIKNRNLQQDANLIFLFEKISHSTFIF